MGGRACTKDSDCCPDVFVDDGKDYKLECDAFSQRCSYTRTATTASPIPGPTTSTPTTAPSDSPTSAPSGNTPSSISNSISPTSSSSGNTPSSISISNSPTSSCLNAGECPYKEFCNFDIFIGKSGDCVECPSEYRDCPLINKFPSGVEDNKDCQNNCPFQPSDAPMTTAPSDSPSGNTPSSISISNSPTASSSGTPTEGPTSETEGPTGSTSTDYPTSYPTRF